MGYLYGPFGKYYVEIIKRNVKQAADGYWGKSMLRIWSMMKSQAWAANENDNVGTLERIKEGLRTELDEKELGRQSFEDGSLQASLKPEARVSNRSETRLGLELSYPLAQAQHSPDNTAPIHYSNSLPLWTLHLTNAPSKGFLAGISSSSKTPSTTSNPFHSSLFVQEPAYPNSHLLTLYYNTTLDHPILSRRIYDERRRLFNGSPPDLVSTPLRKLRLSPFEYNFHAAIRRHIWKAKQGVRVLTEQKGGPDILETWSWDYWKGLAEREIKPNGQPRFFGYKGEDIWHFRPQMCSTVTQRAKAAGAQKEHSSERIQTQTEESHLVDSEAVQGRSLESRPRENLALRDPTISLPAPPENSHLNYPPSSFPSSPSLPKLSSEAIEPTLLSNQLGRVEAPLADTFIIDPSSATTHLNPLMSPKPIHKTSQPAISPQPHVSNFSSTSVARPEVQQLSFLDPNATLPPSTIWAIRTGFFDTPNDASWLYVNTQTLNIPGPTDPNHIEHTYLDQIRDRVKKTLKLTKAIGVSVGNCRNGPGDAGVASSTGGDDGGGVGPVDKTDVIPEADYILELEKELERAQKKIQRACARNWALRYRQPRVVSSQTETTSGGKDEGTGTSGGIGKSQTEQVGNRSATRHGSEWGAGKYIFKHRTKKGKRRKLA